MCMAAGLMAASAADVRQVSGKDLPKVPGPLANNERMKDLVGGPGNSVIELRIRRSARRSGFIPALAVPPGNVAITHTVEVPAGWYAFKVDVPVGEKVKATLQGDHPSWFVVRCVTRMGNLEKGMLQNLIFRGRPEATYINFKKETATVYFVVDTQELVAPNEGYTLTITRDKAS